MQIEDGMNHLPIYNYRSQILQTIKKNTVTIICGETGSGKTTQLPQYLLSNQYQTYNRIMISQPRRISAISLAERVAKQCGSKIGQTIGYSVRFQQKRDQGSQKSRVLFVTDGMAIRELMVGKHYDIYVVDEAHQRSINTDVLLAVLKSMLLKTKAYTKKQSSSDITHRRSGLNQSGNKSNKFLKPFKVVIMSATIDTIKFCQFFNTDAVISVQGRTYPTFVYNVLQPVSDYVTSTFNTILQIHNTEPAGDILAFLTGEEEIVSLKNQLNSISRKSCTVSSQLDEQTMEGRKYVMKPFEVMVLYSALPYEYHMAIFKSSPELQKSRRIILATNIAETSVTIPGIKYVVDSGFMKVRLYQPETRVEVLSVVPISQANAQQRAGRAGRETQGKCYRLYLHNDYQQLAQQMLPQILRSELSSPFLQLKAIGVPSLRDLEFVDTPSSQILQHSLSLLQEIGCLALSNQAERITEKGIEVSKLPLNPLQANLLLLSLDQKYKCWEWTLSLISILSVDNLFYTGDSEAKSSRDIKMNKVQKKFQISNTLHSDHIMKINILHQYILSGNKKSFCKEHFINSKGIKRASQVRNQLSQYLQQIRKGRSRRTFSTDPQKEVTTAASKDNKSVLPLQKYSTTMTARFIECLQKGSMYNIAKLQKSGRYLISRTNQEAQIHPESVCFNLNSKTKPSRLLFSHLVRTSKLYMREITILDN